MGNTILGNENMMQPHEAKNNQILLLFRSNFPSAQYGAVTCYQGVKPIGQALYVRRRKRVGITVKDDLTLHKKEVMHKIAQTKQAQPRHGRG